jgi:hypothetical protein
VARAIDEARREVLERQLHRLAAVQHATFGERPAVVGVVALIDGSIVVDLSVAVANFSVAVANFSVAVAVAIAAVPVAVAIAVAAVPVAVAVAVAVAIAIAIAIAIAVAIAIADLGIVAVGHFIGVPQIRAAAQRPCEHEPAKS